MKWYDFKNECKNVNELKNSIYLFIFHKSYATVYKQSFKFFLSSYGSMGTVELV